MAIAIIRKKGNIKTVDFDVHRQNITFMNKMLLYYIMKEYDKYMTKFHYLLLKDYCKKHKVDASEVNKSQLADDYDDSHIDLRDIFYTKLSKVLNINPNIVLNDYNTALSVLYAFEYKLSIKDENALNSGINALELMYWFTKELIKTVAIILYDCGFEVIPVNLGELASIFISIVNKTNLTLRFPKNNKNTGYDTEILLQSILLPKYIDDIKKHIIIKGA